MKGGENMTEYEGGWDPSDYDEDLSGYSTDWDVAGIVTRNDDGTLEGHSQSTFAYSSVYANDEKLAGEVGDQQGIRHGSTDADLAHHFRGTGAQRSMLGEVSEKLW